MQQTGQKRTGVEGGIKRSELSWGENAYPRTSTIKSLTVSPLGSILTDRDHLIPALRLAAEVLRQPTFPDKEFDEIKRQTLTSIE
jgi:zinc protease